MSDEEVDELVLKVLKTVAKERIILGGDHKPYCCFCPGICSAISINRIEHEPWCETVLARQILQDLGTPLILYQVSYDQKARDTVEICGPRARSQTWQRHEIYTSGFCADEVAKQYATQRNLKIEKVREL